MIQNTREYSLFKFMSTNRDTIPGHVNRLKKAFETYGNLTKVQPILVNENYEIIDGQNRFLAAQELGQPIYFTVAPGLGVDEARSMNILHRGWGVGDYAKSYAEGGNRAYQIYRELQSTYGFTHKIMLMYLSGAVYENSGVYKKFREGNLEISDLDSSIKYLDLYSEVERLAPFNNFGLAAAFLTIFKNPGYDHKRMLKKLALHGEAMLKPMVGKLDNLRQLEEIYNYFQGEATRLRLY